MERKQAVLLLVTMLAVSLVSFSLGVMVGKSGAPQNPPAPLTPAATEKIVVEKSASRESDDETKTTPSAEDSADEKTSLTFFDTLPKSDEPPLGSGINQPPAQKEQSPPGDRLKPVLEEAQIKSETASSVKEQTAQPKAEPAPAVADGRFVVQVGSFRAEGDAGALRDKLLKKDFAVYIQKADLGDKGTWYRVRVGPFADAESARGAADLLKAQEKIDGFVTRR
jgi:cell division septation protein DedD